MQITTINSIGASSTASWAGGKATISFTGTFDGAVCRIESSTDAGASWREVFPRNPGKLFSATTQSEVADIPAGLVRVFVNQAGAGTDVDLNVEPFGAKQTHVIVAAGIHDWAGGVATTDSIAVDGLQDTDVVVCNLVARSGTQTLDLVANDHANDQIALTLSANGADGTCKVSYLVLRAV